MLTGSIILVISSVCCLLFCILMAVAVNLDCKAKNIKAKTAYTVLTFFFPFIVGIVYACTRKNAKKNSKVCVNCNLQLDGAVPICPQCNSANFAYPEVPNAKKLAKNSVIVFIIAVVLYIAAVAGVTYSYANVFVSLLDDTSLSDELGFGEIYYYDREGNRYTDMEQVIYYAQDGSTYNCIFDEDNFVYYFVNTQTENKYESEKCFVDEDGYFVYDENGEIKLDEEYGTTATGADGKTYYVADYVTWNENAEMATGLDLGDLSELFE